MALTDSDLDSGVSRAVSAVTVQRYYSILGSGSHKDPLSFPPIIIASIAVNLSKFLVSPKSLNAQNLKVWCFVDHLGRGPTVFHQFRPPDDWPRCCRISAKNTIVSTSAKVASQASNRLRMQSSATFWGVDATI